MKSHLFVIVFVVSILYLANGQTQNATSSISPTNSTDPGFGGYLEPCLDTCDGEYQVCVDQRCECRHQHKWNATTNSCQYFICQSSQECQTYDSNRYCRRGECVCNDNHLQDYRNGLKCSPKVCYSWSECPNFNCVNSSCQCSPTFQMNYNSGHCEKRNCSSNAQCKSIDENMICDESNTCSCMDLYTYSHDNTQGYKCKPSYCNGFYSECKGKNQVCFGQNCNCAQNYTLSEITGKCELNSCQNSTECQSRDENTFCSNGMCECKTNFAKKVTDHMKCWPQPCTEDAFCAGNQTVCVDMHCKCGPGYQLNDNTGECESFSCKESNECQVYDGNRICSNGTCICKGQLYEADPFNGLKCTEKSCSLNTDCSGNNTVCMDQKCSCTPDHYYSNITQKCEFFECQSSHECQTSDENRICEFGRCVCSNDSKSDSSNGDKCVKSSPTYANSCLDQNECDSKSEVCVDSLCRCAPDYKYNVHLERCMKFQCNQNTDCTEYDFNRVCNYGECVCKDYYSSNAENGGKCTKKSSTYHGYCQSSDYDCYEVNQRCVDSLCHCEPDYKWNENTQRCEYFTCDSSTAYLCGGNYDIYRQCNIYGGCKCDTFYRPDSTNGDKCIRDLPVIPTFDPIIIPTFDPIIIPTFDPIIIPTFDPIIIPTFDPDIDVDTTTTTTYHYHYAYTGVPCFFIIILGGGGYFRYRRRGRAQVVARTTTTTTETPTEIANRNKKFNLFNLN